MSILFIFVQFLTLSQIQFCPTFPFLSNFSILRNFQFFSFFLSNFSTFIKKLFNSAELSFFVHFVYFCPIFNFVPIVHFCPTFQFCTFLSNFSILYNFQFSQFLGPIFNFFSIFNFVSFFDIVSYERFSILFETFFDF